MQKTGRFKLAVPPYESWPPPAGAHISPPYEEVLGPPSYEVCPNCGFEFGFDDNAGASSNAYSFEVYRKNWEQAESVRFSKEAQRDGSGA